MYGIPQEMGPVGFDPSIFLLSGYLLGMLVGLISLALVVGLVTLPLFFFVLFLIEQVSRVVAGTTGAFVSKLVLIMFRGLRRSPLRTSLTYLALFVLTTVLVFLYTILTFIGNVTAEKEANFKAIVTHKTVIPSQIKPGYYNQFKDLVLNGLPPDMRPVNGENDIMSWSFVGGSTDPINKRPDNALFMFCMEPQKITTMMDGLDDLTGDEKRIIDDGIEKMLANKQAIVVSQSRLKKLNVRVGQKIKLYGLNYPDMIFEFEIVGSLPDGKYEGVGFMNKDYLDQLLKTMPADYLMQDKALNLIWVRLPNKMAFERLSAMVDDPKNFNSPPIKMETASSGIGSWMEAYKDIFFGMKYILTPAMVGIMCLVIANAISIGVRERRTEMAVLKVLGFQPRHVMALVLGEAVLVGLLAGGMAAFLSWFGIGNLKMQIAFFGAFIVPWQALVYGPALGVGVAFLGSLGPALSAKNVRVAEVFARVA
ncbi:MAG: FtsX-like permease family protein [Gemmataceae bacterium]|nr:FtsX-like permease family protein [Gemmataceae bacterium]